MRLKHYGMTQMQDLVVHLSINVQFAKFFFPLKPCKNRQNLKSIGTYPGIPICSTWPEGG